MTSKALLCFYVLKQQLTYMVLYLLWMADGWEDSWEGPTHKVQDLENRKLIDCFMEIRFQNSPKETGGMNTQELRENFLIENLMQEDTIQLVYSHSDRVIIGGAKPITKTLSLETHTELKAD